MGAPISLKGVSKSYPRGNEIVRAVRPTSLDISEGAFVVITGESGSGKSTLLNLVAGYERADEGVICIGASKQEGYIKPGLIGFIFQNFRLLPLLSARENVELALLPLESRAAKRRTRALAALQQVGLEDRRAHRPSELSGGQQQRVSIARAVVVRPDVILADEPTANLDSATGEQVMLLLKRLGHESNCTILIATHDRRWISMSDTHITMKDGEVVS